MNEAGRRLRLWSLIAEKAHGTSVSVEHVCRAAVSATGTDSAAVMVRLATSPRETLFASDPRAAAIEELALTVGEGPCLDAWSGSPALAPDLGTVESQLRWPAFAPAAVNAGIRAAFALPLQIGAIHLGSMNLYRERPGTLTREQLADALTLADAAQGLLLDAVRNMGDGDGQVDAEARPMWARPPHPEVHQAIGMITVQLEVTATVAFARLRAYAFAHDRRLHDVARDVVGRRLRFSPEDDEMPQNGTSPQNGETRDEVEGNG